MVSLIPSSLKKNHRGAVRTGQLTVRGGLQPEVVGRVLRQAWGRWLLCYERELDGDPKLAGAVELKFDVDAQGAVRAPRIGTSTLAAPRLRRCLVDTLSALAFPTPSELPAEVTEQLELQPRRQQPKNSNAPAAK